MTKLNAQLFTKTHRRAVPSQVLEAQPRITPRGKASFPAWASSGVPVAGSDEVERWCSQLFQNPGAHANVVPVEYDSMNFNTTS